MEMEKTIMDSKNKPNNSGIEKVSENETSENNEETPNKETHKPKKAKQTKPNAMESVSDTIEFTNYNEKLLDPNGDEAPKRNEYDED